MKKIKKNRNASKKHTGMMSSTVFLQLNIYLQTLFLKKSEAISQFQNQNHLGQNCIISLQNKATLNKTQSLLKI